MPVLTDKMMLAFKSDGPSDTVVSVQILMIRGVIFTGLQKTDSLTSARKQQDETGSFPRCGLTENAGQKP